MRVYVAGSTSDVERVNRVQAAVRRQGWCITFDWTEGEIRDEADERGREVSIRQVVACASADLTIVLCPPNGIGCWIEMGATLAAGGWVWVVEPHRDSVFWQHPRVWRFPSIDAALTKIEDADWRRT